MSQKQCNGCGGFCRPSGCERKNSNDLIAMAFAIADRSSIELIDCEFHRADHVTRTIPLELIASDHVIAEAVDYLCQRGLAHRHCTLDEVVVILETET